MKKGIYQKEGSGWLNFPVQGSLMLFAECCSLLELGVIWTDQTYQGHQSTS